MDSPSRELDRILEEAQKDMLRLEREQREHEEFLGNVGGDIASSPIGRHAATSRSMNGEDESTYMSGQDLHAQMAHLRMKTTSGAGVGAPLKAGPATLHGQVKAARNLLVSRGTCDPFVKVSYVPPSEDGSKTSLALRAKQKVHATEVVSNTSEPSWSQNMFRLDVEPPVSAGGKVDWDKLRGDLLFAVYDSNEGLRNEFIGQVVFPLRSLVDGLSADAVHAEGQTLHDVWCPLVGRRGGNSNGDKPSIASISRAEPGEPALQLVMQLILPEREGKQKNRHPTEGSGNSLGSTAPTPSKSQAPGSRINHELLIGDSLADRIALSAERGVDYYSPRDGKSDIDDADEDADFEDDERGRFGKGGSAREKSNEDVQGTSRKPSRKKAIKKRKKGGIKVKRAKFRSRFETANRIEQARIAKENLIFQRQLQKTRKCAGAGYGKATGKSAAQKFQEQSSRATRERMKRELKKANEHHNARISKTRGEIKPKPEPLPAWEQDNLDREERLAAVARERKAHRDRYQREAENNAELEQLRGYSAKLLEEISVLQTKSQRYETMTRRNRKSIAEAEQGAALRDAAAKKGRKKKKESALPDGAKSLSALVPGSGQSEFTKRFGGGPSKSRSGRSKRGAVSKYDSEDSADEDAEIDEVDLDRLAEVRGELAERLVTYEAAEKRRKKHLDRARAARSIALEHEARLEKLLSQLKKVKLRREWTAREAHEENRREGKSSVAGFDPEFAQIMAEKAKLNAVTVDVEALKFEVEDMRRDQTYELEALMEEKSALEARLSRKQSKLDAEVAKHDALQNELNENLKSGKIEQLTEMIRNMRNAELLCRHARDNKKAFEDDARLAVRHAQNEFNQELRRAEALEHSQGYM